MLCHDPEEETTLGIISYRLASPATVESLIVHPKKQECTYIKDLLLPQEMQ
jgi:hypothetical protein